MSFRLSVRVFDLDLSAKEKLVLRALADHANDNGTSCYPSVRRLMEKTSLSRRTVQTTLRSLERKGLLVHIGQSKGGRGHTPEYRLTLDKAQSGARPSPRAKRKTQSKGAPRAPFPENQRAQELHVKGAKGDGERAQNSPIKGAGDAPDSKVFTLSVDSVMEAGAISAHDAAADSSPNTDSKTAAPAFLAIGFDHPFGHKPFQEIWLKNFATPEPWITQRMEATIQECNAQEIKIPPQFFDAKRDVEKRENGEFEGANRKVPL